MQIKLVLGSTIIATSLFLGTTASADTIQNKEMSISQATSNLVNEEITSDYQHNQDVQLQSATSQIYQGINEQHDNIVEIPWNAKNWYDGYFDMNNPDVNNRWRMFGTALAAYSGGPFASLAYQLAWEEWATPKG